MKRMKTSFTDVDAVLRQCIEWSQWSWLKVLKDTHACTTAVLDLERCNIRCTFPAHVLAQTQEGGPEVRHQDAQCSVLVSYIDHLTTNRSGSMLKWTSQYPEKLVGLLSAPSQKRTLEELKIDVEAWWAAKVHMTMICTFASRQRSLATSLRPVAA